MTVCYHVLWSWGLTGLSWMFLFWRPTSDCHHTRLGLLFIWRLHRAGCVGWLFPCVFGAWVGVAGSDWADLLFRHPSSSQPGLPRNSLSPGSLISLWLPASLRASVLRHCKTFYDLCLSLSLLPCLVGLLGSPRFIVEGLHGRWEAEPDSWGGYLWRPTPTVHHCFV